MRLRLVPDDTKIPFMRWRRVSFGVSALIIAASLLSWLTLGFNFGIDFQGGTLIEARSLSGPANLAEVRSTLSNLDVGDVQVQEFGQPSDILIRLPQQEGGDAAQQAAVSRVREALGAGYEHRRTEVVGPSVSADLRRNGVIAVVVSLLGVLAYIWFRFEWQFAIGAILTTLHDIVATLGLISLLQITFDLPILAAILTIVGYSLNDTVVIYDRIRENLRRYKRMPLPDLIDASINQTLSRTVATSMTTFLAVLALFIFGGEALRGFNFTMLVGILLGIYSSVVISAPVLILFKLRASTVAEPGSEVGTPARPAAPAE